MEKVQPEIDGKYTDERTRSLVALLCAGGRELYAWPMGSRPNSDRLATQSADRHWIGRAVAHVAYMAAERSRYVPM